MASYWRNYTFLEGVSFEEHEEFQLTLSLLVRFSERVAKSYFFVKFAVTELLKLDYINFDTYCFVYFPIS